MKNSHIRSIKKHFIAKEIKNSEPILEMPLNTPPFAGKMAKKQFHQQIHFWIFLFFLVRLFGITDPPLEYNHNWRQVSGLMVARNFFETNNNIFYPKTDDFLGNKGNLGMEFPLLNYLHYLTSVLLGYEHWYGRLINLIISSLGLFYFYKILVALDFKRETALAATLFLASSIWFSFSRKMMPDTFSVSMIFIGIYYGIKFLNHDRFIQLILYSIITSLAILSKIPAYIYFIAFLIFTLSIKSKIQFKSKVKLFIATIPCFILPYCWYILWCEKLSTEFGYWFISERPFLTGLKEIVLKYNLTLFSFIFNSFHSYIIFFYFIFGLVFLFIKKEKFLSIFFLIVSALFLIYVLKSGWFFYHHTYYIIPFVPIMALVAGYAVTQIKSKWIVASLIFLGILESIGNQRFDFFINRSEEYKMTLEGILEKISDKDDLILINGNGNPQMLYLAHRKGWNCVDWQITELRHIRKIIDFKCKFIVINKNSNDELSNLQLPLKIAYIDDNFLIYHTLLIKNDKHICL